MSKTTNTTQSPKQQAVCDRSPLVRWEEATTAEQRLLTRVEGQLLGSSEKADQETSQTSPSPGSRSFWKPIAAVGLLGCLLTLGWLGWRSPRALPTLQAQGTLTLTPLRDDKAQNQWLQTSLLRNATLRDPQGWRLQALNKVGLRVIRDAPRRARLQLETGAVALQVTPRAMKQFAVVCRHQIEVIVKGTQFLVWQNQTGLRVEVSHGHVLLRQSGRELLHLYQGQGALLRKGRLAHTYAVPKATATPTQRLSVAWLATAEQMASHHKEQLYPYVQALLKEGLLTPRQTQQILELTAHALQGAKQWQKASQMWLQLAATKAGGYATQTALFQAAQSCRRASAASHRCAHLYQQYLRRYPKGLTSLREASLYWSGALLQSHQPALSQQRLRLYLKRYPQGTYAAKARQILRTTP